MNHQEIKRNFQKITKWRTLNDMIESAKINPIHFDVIIHRASEYAINELITNPTNEIWLTHVAGILLEFSKNLDTIGLGTCDILDINTRKIIAKAWAFWMRDIYHLIFQHQKMVTCESLEQELWNIEDPIPIPAIKSESLRIYANLLQETGPGYHGVADRKPNQYLCDKSFYPSWATLDEWDSMIRYEIESLEKIIGMAYYSSGYFRLRRNDKKRVL